MSGKGCQLLVSPCGMSPSLGKIRGHQSQVVKVPVAFPPRGSFPFSGANKVSSGKQNGGPVTLPSLSLHRKVLTNGKRDVKPAVSLYRQDASIQGGSSKKGSGDSRPAIEVLGHPAGWNPTVTSSPMSVVPSQQQDVVASYRPPLDARSVLSRESLASTTLGLFESQSVFSDWPFGYRVQPPPGRAPCSAPACESGEQLGLPLGRTMSSTETSGGWSTSASLPSYLFAGDAGSSRQHNVKKRALSTSPLSEVMGADFNSIIRTLPTSLVAYINSSPTSHPTLSPVQSEGYGHFLGVRGSYIPQVHPYAMPDSLPALISPGECGRKKVLEEGGAPGSQMANMVVEQQWLPNSQKVAALGNISETCSEETNHRPTPQLQSVPLPVEDAVVPQGPPPPYHSHRHIHLPRIHHKIRTQDAVNQGPVVAPRHCLSFFPQIPMLEEEEGESEDCGAHRCLWADCGAVYDQKDELAKHIAKLHVDQRKAEDFTCYWAGCPRNLKPFNARYKLLIHMRVHSGEKPNKCMFKGCKKAFSRLENLKIHLRSHTGEKPYLCQHPGCFKAFSNSSDRAKHQRIHLDTKPYLCQVPGCAKRYTDPSSLRKHVKSHSTAERQLRKKMKSTSDVTQESLTDCLTIHHLHHSLSPPARRDNLIASSREPFSSMEKTPLSFFFCFPPHIQGRYLHTMNYPLDLHCRWLHSKCISSPPQVSPQGGDSPHDPHSALMCTLQDSHRFVDPPPSQIFCTDLCPPLSGLPHPPSDASMRSSRTPGSAADHSPDLSGQMEALFPYDGMSARAESGHLGQVDAFGGSGICNTGFDVQTSGGDFFNVMEAHACQVYRNPTEE
ncbi:zinc finger protein GLIS3 isoform X2 [Hippocampus zosterae]|uniref:zinc finger protein GLIS3 isoform X2 n=1 Tax=Hippocampus zosterae TaxID=109293 RepID=UPI00223D389A|nr:zinc finger protein GLIS3 isoform X2 [Hippocampus zosterae]